MLQSSHPLPWWQLFTLLTFSQPASAGMLFQSSWVPTYAEHLCAAFPSLCSPTHPKPSQLGWGWVIVEARSSDAALHQSLYWSNSPCTVWRCVGSLSWWKNNDSPTKRKPAGMVYRYRMLSLPCWLSVPWILNKWLAVSPAKHPHNITPPPPCFTTGTTHAEIILSSTLRLTKTRRLEPKIWNSD